MTLFLFFFAWVMGAIALIASSVFAGILTGVFGAVLVAAALAIAAVCRRQEIDFDQFFWKPLTAIAIVSGIGWAFYFSYLFIQSDSEFSKEVKGHLTLGYTNGPKPPPVEELGTSIRRYKLLEMRPPKHFYVSIEDVETKQTFDSVYVSKHCNTYRNNKLGDEYNLTVMNYRQGDKQWYKFVDLYASFCS